MSNDEEDKFVHVREKNGKFPIKALNKALKSKDPSNFYNLKFFGTA